MTEVLTQSIHLIRELGKANNEYGKLSDRFTVLHDFVKKIVKDWGCDPNHASAILAEVERMNDE